MSWAVFVSDEAASDRQSIFDYIADRDSFDSALHVDGLIRKGLGSLREMPERGNVPPTLRRYGITEYRQFWVKPYRILYRVLDSERQVWVVAIIDGRRDADELLRERVRRG